MNVEISQHSVRASIIKYTEELTNDESQDKTASVSTEESHESNNNEMNHLRPRFTDEGKNYQTLQRQYDELHESNKLMKKQLMSRDEILKHHLAKILSIKTDNNKQLQFKQALKSENETLKRELEAEKWLSEKLRQDIRDLQIRVDFEDCYVQEQAYKMGLMETMLDELQKTNTGQKKEILELKKQLNRTKEQLDNQILDLQKMLRI